MKKAAAILFLLLFQFTNSGIAVNVHWCGGKIASINFFSEGKHNCPCGKKVNTRRCCKDKTVTLKANHELAKAHQFAVKVSLPKLEKIVVIIQNEIATALDKEYFASGFYHPPPYKPRTPIFLLDRVIRI